MSCTVEGCLSVLRSKILQQMLIMLSLDCGWIATSEGRCDSVPRDCFVSQLSSWRFVAQLLQRVVSVTSCAPKVCSLNQGGYLPLLAHRENGLTEIQRVTLQPCWYE